MEAYAAGKIHSKKLDMIAANQVGVEGSGFTGDDNCLTVLGRNGARDIIARASKSRVAEQLVELIAKQYKAE